MAGSDQRNILGRNAVIRPPEAERVEDLGGENLANVPTGGRRDDLAHQRTPRQPVVDVHQARPVQRLQFAELLPGVLAVVHAFEVGPGSAGDRDARAVGHHVPDRGAVLAVAGVGRQVVAHAVVEREFSPFDQHVHDRRRDRLGRRVRAERRFRCDRHLFGVRRIGRRVTPAVADRRGSGRLFRCAAGTVGSPDACPPGYQCRAACQIRSIDAASTPEWSSSPTAVTASRSAGTRIRPLGRLGGHAGFLCSVAARWCCSGWPTAPIRSV